MIPEAAADPTVATLEKPPVWTVFGNMLLVILLGGAGAAVTLGVMLPSGVQEAGETIEARIQRVSLTAEYLFSCAIASALALALVSVVATRAWSWSRARERLRLRAGRLSPTVTLLGVLGAIAISHVMEIAIHLLGVSGRGTLGQIEKVLTSASGGSRITAIVAIGVAAPIAEELFFRGYMQTRLSERWGRRAAILVTAAAFALIHFDAVHSSFALVIGSYFGWLAESTGSIRAPMVAHLGNNLLATLGVKAAGSVAGWTLLAASVLIIPFALRAVNRASRR